jgi:hypothetical protein
MLALSIRQPFAELILRGIKRVEYRSRATRQVGRRFWIYVSRQMAAGSRPHSARSTQHPALSGTHTARGTDATLAAARSIWSNDLAVPAEMGRLPLPDWMIELAEDLILGRLPTGVIVGSAVIERCQEIRAAERPADKSVRRAAPLFAWHLVDVEPVTRPRKPARRPQPVWFRPF